MRLNIERAKSIKLKSIGLVFASTVLIMGSVVFAAPQFFGQVANAVGTQEEVNCSINEINLANEKTISSVLSTNANKIGIYMGNYNILTATGKNVVNKALVGKNFVNSQTLINAFFLAQLEAQAVDAMNIGTANGVWGSKSKSSEIGGTYGVIESYYNVLGLDLAMYHDVLQVNQPVYDALYHKGFTNGPQIKSAFDIAVNDAIFAENKPTTGSASDVGLNDAVLNGTSGQYGSKGASFWASTSMFKTDSSAVPAGVYNTSDSGPLSANRPFSVALSSTGITVKPNTTYYFAAWSLSDGVWYPGEVHSFTTPPLDTTSPSISVKPESIGHDGIYSKISFKLYDAGNVKSFSINNGTERFLSPSPWSDANNIAVGSNGGLLGNNTIVLKDLAGNSATHTFILDNTNPILTINTPKSVISGENVMFTGTVNEEAKSLILTIDGHDYIPTIDGNDWTYNLDTTDLNAGTYDATISAVDLAGNLSVDNAEGSVTSLTVKPPYTANQPSVATVALAEVTTTAVTADVDNTQAQQATSSNPDTLASVLGAQTTKEDTSDPLDNTAALASTDKGWSIFGLMWYWWVVIAAAVASAWWIISAAIRRRGQDA